MNPGGKKNAPRNRTLDLSPAECDRLAGTLLRPDRPLRPADAADRLIHDDLRHAAPLLPDGFADLLILDPPYNLDKEFNGRRFAPLDDAGYVDYLGAWLDALRHTLKPDASIYLCGDWRCSAAGYLALSSRFRIRNRIVWQREKGRGARSNWKNCTEDIWFATVSDDYHFDVNAVKQLRRVLAPYRDNGAPKDWRETPEGRFRLTCPSNFWDDLTVPFWSMPEKTPHPTQKPEKLLAKLILASSRPGDQVLDPFSGSGTTAVTARK
ncbi:MAG: site-specific DNA-methyltransferase, partial [Lentisphaeria bacterium]|nr:site-specific DNA-methyltransferase [Lentisphaeria bacterium]